MISNVSKPHAGQRRIDSRIAAVVTALKSLLLILELRREAHIRSRLSQRLRARFRVVERNHGFRSLKAYLGFGDTADLQQ